MAWNSEKFLALPPATQAKKLADLLERLVENWHKDPAEFITEYHRLCGLLGSGEPGPLEFSAGPPTPSLLHAMAEHYMFWRARAKGDGPKASFFERLGALASGTTGMRTEIENAGRPSGPGQLCNNRTLPGAAVLLHNLRSAHNVGSIIRSAECFGFGRVYLSGYTPGVDSTGVAAAAMGCERLIPITRLGSWQACLEDFRETRHGAEQLGFQPKSTADETTLPGPDASAKKKRPEPVEIVVCALENAAGAIAIDKFVWPTQTLLVVGNEALGIAPNLLSACDRTISIRLLGQKSTLNVANAFAIAAYEFARAVRV